MISQLTCVRQRGHDGEHDYVERGCIVHETPEELARECGKVKPLSDENKWFFERFDRITLPLVKKMYPVLDPGELTCVCSGSMTGNIDPCPLDRLDYVPDGYELPMKWGGRRTALTPTELKRMTRAIRNVSKPGIEIVPVPTGGFVFDHVQESDEHLRELIRECGIPAEYVFQRKDVGRPASADEMVGIIGHEIADLAKSIPPGTYEVVLKSDETDADRINVDPK